MTDNIKLTDTQRDILKLAAHRPDGDIEPLPPTLRGGARLKVIEGLMSRNLCERVDDFDNLDHAPRYRYLMSDAGYAAIGRTRPEPEVPIDPQIEDAAIAAEERWHAEKQAAAQRLLKVGVEGSPRRTRQNSKQAEVIAMLGRPDGATIAQICAATGWQAHTVRGTLSGAFKKRLGLVIASEKPEGGVRTYRLAA